MRVSAVSEQSAVVRHILDHLGIPVPSRAERPPPGPARRLTVAEAPAWTDDPVDADLPLGGAPARLRGSPRSPTVLALPTTDSAEDLAAVALDTPIHRW